MTILKISTYVYTYVHTINNTITVFTSNRNVILFIIKFQALYNKIKKKFL